MIALPRSAILVLLSRFYKEGVPVSTTLFVEGLMAALLGTGFAWWLFPAETSLVAVFLTALATSDSMERLLGWNRTLIIEQGVVPRRANTALTVRVLVLFLGMVAAFSFFGLGLEPSLVEELFRHQVEDFGTLAFSDLDFGRADAIFVHNIYVLLFFLIIAIPFRHGGVMLAVAWNASVWGASFGVLARAWNESGGPALPLAWLRVMGAITPHLVFEATAYVMAGMAGVFLSKGLLKYSLDSDRMLSIVKTVGFIVLLAVVLVGLGALWEGFVSPVAVRVLSG